MSSSPLQFVNARTQPHTPIAKLITPAAASAAPDRCHPWPARPRRCAPSCWREPLPRPERSPCQKLREPGIFFRALLVHTARRHVHQQQECAAGSDPLFQRLAPVSACRPSNSDVARALSKPQSHALPDVISIATITLRAARCRERAPSTRHQRQTLGHRRQRGGRAGPNEPKSAGWHPNAWFTSIGKFTFGRVRRAGLRWRRFHQGLGRSDPRSILEF